MLDPFIICFQFFEAQEKLIIDELQSLQACILNLDPRFVSESDYDRFFHLKVELDLLRRLETKLLTLLKPYGKMQ